MVHTAGPQVERTRSPFREGSATAGSHARQVLTEMNTSLLLDTGHLTETGLRRTADGGLNASWALTDDGRCDENPDQFRFAKRCCDSGSVSIFHDGKPDEPRI